MTILKIGKFGTIVVCIGHIVDDNAFKIVLYEFQHGTISYDADHLETLFSTQFLTNILPSVILIVTLTLI